MLILNYKVFFTIQPLFKGGICMYINRSNIKVRYVETDQMGIVHHSNYYAYFEVGRGEYIKKIGMTYREMESLGIMLPLVESQCRYIEGAKYEDDLIIETYVEELTCVKIVFNYNVIREKDNKLLAKGRTVQAFVGNDFKIVNLKKKNPDLWAKMEAVCIKE